MAMTGCIGDEDILFTIYSSHNVGSPHFIWTKEGAVETINADPIVSTYHFSKPIIDNTKVHEFLSVLIKFQ